MERIVIEVDDATAKKWRKVPVKIKTQLEKSFERQIEIISQSTKESHFEDLLKQAREEAAKNGLTEEILQQLLNEE
jgi:plasmid maintenance system killer protein